MSGKFGNVSVAHILPQHPVDSPQPPLSTRSSSPPRSSPSPRSYSLTTTEKILYLGSVVLATLLVMFSLLQTVQLSEVSHKSNDLEKRIQQAQRDVQILETKLQGLEDPSVVEKEAVGRGFIRDSHPRTL